jgi:hypothetical protein
LNIVVVVGVVGVGVVFVVVIVAAPMEAWSDRGNEDRPGAGRFRVRHAAAPTPKVMLAYAIIEHNFPCYAKPPI